MNETTRFTGRRREARQAAVALQETVRIALDTLRAHKLRTFLTLLGVILAVTTLVAVISVLNGLNVYVSDKVANLGANALVVDKIGIVTNLDQWTKARKRPATRHDGLRSAARRDETGSVCGRGAEQCGGRALWQRIDGGRDDSGSDAAFPEIRQIELASGRLFTQADEDHAANVCIIGMDVVNKVMPGVDPVGKEIRAGQGAVSDRRRGEAEGNGTRAAAR